MPQSKRRTSGRTKVAGMSSSQLSYAIAAICVIIAMMLVAREFMFSEPRRRTRHGYAAYTDSRYRPHQDAAETAEEATKRQRASGHVHVPKRPMTEAEWALARAANVELAIGRRIFEQAGNPGAPQEQSKLAEARPHLKAAQEKFAQIDGEPTIGLEASIEECNRLLIQCNRRTILHVGR